MLKIHWIKKLTNKEVLKRWKTPRAAEWCQNKKIGLPQPCYKGKKNEILWLIMEEKSKGRGQRQASKCMTERSTTIVKMFYLKLSTKWFYIKNISFNSNPKTEEVLKQILHTTTHINPSLIAENVDFLAYLYFHRRDWVVSISSVKKGQCNVDC